MFAVSGMLASSAEAGVNAGGVLGIHHESGVVYTDGGAYCSTVLSVASCEDIIASVTSSDIVVCHVLALFPSGATPEISGVTFGVSYDVESLAIEDQGTCGDFEIAESAWPASGSGTATTWVIPQDDAVLPVYWFAAQAYEGAVLALGPHPRQGGWFADAGTPPVLDEIAAFGSLGFGVAGNAPCPAGTDGPGEGGQEGQDDQQPDSGDGSEGPMDDDGGSDPADDDGGTGEGESGPMGGDGGDSGTTESPLGETPTRFVNVRVHDAALLEETTSATAFPPASATFLSVGLRGDLATSGAVTIRKSVPWMTPADTLVTNLAGQPIRVPDVSRFFEVEYASAEAAEVGALQLETSEGIVYAEQVLTTPPYSLDDPIYYEPGNQQWYLDNTRGAVGEDLNLETSWPYSQPDARRYRIGSIDTGIRDTHEDLDVIGDDAMEALPLLDYCGAHGTEMAGVAGARTQNGIGMAGVCSHCDILDIASCTGCVADSCTGMEVDLGRITYAMSQYWPVDFLLVETGGPAWGGDEPTAALYMAYRSGTLSFAPAANGKYPDPSDTILDPPALSGLPFVVGVGGFTENGKFWGSDPDCIYLGSDGSAIGQAVDVAGPACYGATTTSQTGNADYAHTRLLNSGATAAVAGFASHHFMVAESERYFGEGNPGPDDRLGMILAATRPFVNQGTLVSDYGCQNCTESDFGRGIPDGQKLWTLIDRISRAVTSQVRVHTVSYSDHLADPERTVFEPVDVNLPGPQDDIMWGTDWHGYKLWKLEQRSWVPPTGDPELPDSAGAFPRHLVWPNHVGGYRGPETTTPMWFQPTDNELGAGPVQRNNRMNQMRSNGITSCYLQGPDPITGEVVLTGYVIEEFQRYPAVPDTVRLGWMHDPESLVMSYTHYSLLPPTAGVHPTESGAPATPVLDVRQNPSRGKVVFSSRDGADVEAKLEVFDAAGRLVWQLDWPRATGATGHSTVVWDGSTLDRGPAPAGVYWARLRTAAGSSARKIVIVR